MVNDQPILMRVLIFSRPSLPPSLPPLLGCLHHLAGAEPDLRLRGVRRPPSTHTRLVSPSLPPSLPPSLFPETYGLLSPLHFALLPFLSFLTSPPSLPTSLPPLTAILLGDMNYRVSASPLEVLSLISKSARQSKVGRERGREREREGGRKGRRDIKYHVRPRPWKCCPSSASLLGNPR